jgi:hypothetical protein
MTLEGHPQIYVAVESFSKVDKALGFSEVDFKEEAEALLKDGGVLLFDEQNWQVSEYMPILYITATTTATKYGEVAAYAVTVEFYQLAYLKNTRLSYGVCTWSHGAVGMGDRDDILQASRKSVRVFIKRWQVMNGGQHEKKGK